MKKQRHHLLKTLVTMLLVVTMVLSTAVTAMAAPGGRWGRGWNWGSWGSSAAETAEEEEPAVESEPEAAVEEAAEEPAAEEEAAAEEAAEEAVPEETPAEEILPLEESVGTLTVKVEDPNGVLPEGTQLQIEKVDAADYQSDVEDAAGEGTKIALAVNITFTTADGEAFEPKGDVKVTMSAPEIEEIENPEIVHIPDEGSAEKIEQADEDSADDEVVFESGEFSVYAVVWKDAGGIEQSATVHWGTYNGGVFEELESPTTLDTTASSVKLDVIIDGYYFVGAEYKATESSDGVNLTSTTLKKATDGTWQVKLEGSGTVTIADGSHIYVNYAPMGSGGYTPPTPPLEVLAPVTTKNVEDNKDGTYTITLNIEGKEDQEITQVGANVIIVMDITQSMTNRMPNSARNRMQAAKAALTTLIDTLKPSENLINFTAVNFGETSSYSNGVNWTQNEQAMRTYVTGLPDSPNQYGTCWQAGLQGGKDRVGTAPAGNETYVLFVTDGNPNCYTDNNGRWHGSTGPNFNQNAYNAAVPNANWLGANSHLYGIFVGDADGHGHLNDLITNAHGVRTINGTDEENLKDEFGDIAETIVDNLGTGSAILDDGVPSLSNISANVTAGEAGGFEYYITPKNGDQTVWEGAPGASYSNSNGVTWNLSEAGNLKDGWIYTLKFTVWPSQKAYDLIADLNNHKQTMTEDELEAAGIAKNGGVYTLKTNTHLYTTFKDLEGNEYRKVNDYREEAMNLPTKTISIKKEWPANFLDEYGAATYRDEDGNEKTATEITLTLERDSEDYLDVTVNSEYGWQKDDVYISCGQIVVKDGNADIKEVGHDYKVVEPEAFSYYWDLISDVYHPMVINGTATMLILNEKLTADDVDNATVFKIGGKFYEVKSGDHDILEADNYRRSNLNLTKVVSTAGGKDDYFTYTATVTDANSTDGKVWFSARDKENATVKDTDWVISGATAEEGNTGYWYADNGATVTLKIKQGWNVRFLNLYHGSTFSFEEIKMPEFYKFEKAEAAHEYDFKDTDIEEDDWHTIEDEKVSGTIVEPNNSYTITYTNKYEAFYVYHSGVAGGGNLEIVGMPASGKYDLTQNLTANTLYGGYYLDYAGKGDYKDDGIKGTTGVAYTGMNYEWVGAQTVLGTEIEPVAGETYYIKEVPTYYLRNYHQINYVKSTGELKALYLISAVDDLNYQETGFTLTNGNQKAKVVSKMTFKNYATNKSVTLKANTVFKSLEITKEGEYLTYFDATGSAYFATGSFTVLPYWITPDGITVNGTSTRTITITDLTKSGITKIDS